MHQNVIVSFSKDKLFDYKLTPDDLAGHGGEQARRWFDQQFRELECDVPSPMGKVLVVDRSSPSPSTPASGASATTPTGRSSSPATPRQ